MFNRSELTMVHRGRLYPWHIRTTEGGPRYHINIHIFWYMSSTSHIRTNLRLFSKMTITSCVPSKNLVRLGHISSQLQLVMDVYLNVRICQSGGMVIFRKYTQERLSKGTYTRHVFTFIGSPSVTRGIDSANISGSEE